ncbi:hypothetical protein A3Q56_04103 [Intoshia linei]|uniref:Diphthamide synthase domain-containing protein n=1 Tax=Intoshia linei TaxID=1819745 RepID=A0A177B322_9BILA|nr:hypothetical protein A3Q56_04103 [Intoshia linei]
MSNLGRLLIRLDTAEIILDQHVLLDEMISSKLNSIIIKTSSMDIKECERKKALKRKQSSDRYRERSSMRNDIDNSLSTQYSLDSSMLGKTIEELKPTFEKINKEYQMNVCGEGGEYETFTLDCPLFKEYKIELYYKNCIKSKNMIRMDYKIKTDNKYNSWLYVNGAQLISK